MAQQIQVPAGTPAQAEVWHVVKTRSWADWLIPVFVIALTTPTLAGGHITAWMIPLPAMFGLYVVLRWLSSAELVFDSVGVSISDRYWRYQGRAPIRFAYPEGIAIVIESGTAWVNGLRISTGVQAVKRLESAASLLGLGFTRAPTSFRTAAPTLLMFAALVPLFVVRGRTGSVLFFVIYGCAMIAETINFVGGYRGWERIAAYRGQR